jgi:tRNA pseudouridine38-40 synthase
MGRVADLGKWFEGEHDFAGLQCTGSAVASTRRTLYAVTVHQGGIVGPYDAADLWRIEFHGNGFLYKMVRNMTGALIDIARGAVPEQRLEELLASPGPFHGHTAPAHGLTLVEVAYER